MFHRMLMLGAAVLAIAGAAQAQGRPDDRRFLVDAIRGDNSEITLGQLASQRAASPSVRDFGRMLQRDHSRARADAVRVADRMDVRTTREMTPEARQAESRLRRLRGRSFDNEFLRYMVGDHRRDISMSRRQAGGRGPVADLARRGLPDLQHHLDTAMRLSRG